MRYSKSRHHSTRNDFPHSISNSKSQNKIRQENQTKNQRSHRNLTKIWLKSGTWNHYCEQTIQPEMKNCIISIFSNRLTELKFSAWAESLHKISPKFIYPSLRNETCIVIFAKLQGIPFYFLCCNINIAKLQYDIPSVKNKNNNDNNQRAGLGILVFTSTYLPRVEKSF